ncbi:MAG: competence protein ComEA [Chloroflexi bacterium]|nr:competence protein ComEA [Chloroflexota bacterium]
MSSIGSKRILATLVSVLAAVAVLGAAAWMLIGNGQGTPQDDADVRIIPPVDAANADASGGVEAAGDGRQDETPVPLDIAVYVTGEVVNPGVYTVSVGERLTNVVELAGGATENADLDRINLAAYVSDAAHYRIPAIGETNDGSAGSAAIATVSDGTATPDERPSPACAVPLNINTATVECLETLPGIGSVRAQAIVAHREQSGPFVTTDGITAVSGIGDGIYGRVADMITVGGQ